MGRWRENGLYAVQGKDGNVELIRSDLVSTPYFMPEGISDVYYMYKVDLVVEGKWYGQAIPASAYGVVENGVNVPSHLAMFGHWNGGLLSPEVDQPLVLMLLLEMLRLVDEHRKEEL